MRWIEFGCKRLDWRTILNVTWKPENSHLIFFPLSLSLSLSFSLCFYHFKMINDIPFLGNILISAIIKYHLFTFGSSASKYRLRCQNVIMTKSYLGNRDISLFLKWNVLFSITTKHSIGLNGCWDEYCHCIILIIFMVTYEYGRQRGL